jgi:Rieske Fe-S protein
MDDIPLAPLEARKPAGSVIKPLGTPGHGPLPETARRGFFYNLFTAMVAGMVGVVPLAAGLAVYLDPLRRKSAAGSMRPVTTIDKLPDAKEHDALIGRFQIIADRVDAWNVYPNEPIGGVYLVVPKGTDKVKALHATCPHLGCSVDLKEGENGEYTFKCPCHTSTFTGDGTRIMPCVSPRDMDELVCETKKLADGRQQILVQFQNFMPGIEAKKAKS